MSYLSAKKPHEIGDLLPFQFSNLPSLTDPDIASQKGRVSDAAYDNPRENQALM